MSVSPNRWPVQRAKENFSALVQAAATDGDQTVTRHGREVAVIVSIDRYRQLSGDGRSLWDVLSQDAPQDTEFVEIMRQIEDKRRNTVPDDDDLPPDFGEGLAL